LRNAGLHGRLDVDAQEVNRMAGFADVPDAILTAIQWQFYDSPTRAAILAMGLG
jgi:hypothetical protein